MDVSGKRLTTCSTAGPMFVTVKDNKILRVEPMQFDPNEVDSWEVCVNGKTYRPPLSHPLLPWGLVTKQMNASENRVNHPYKRKDWDPNGDRNPQNRGISDYERISWDEVFNIIEAEMRRILDTYGNSALCRSFSAHPEWGSLHYFFSEWNRFWDMIGSTELVTSPISWEGWAAGATFVWGFWPGMGFPPATDTLQDISESSELIVLWGIDPMLHNVYNGIDTARLWQYWRDLGKEIIVIDPMSNELAVMGGSKWIPIYPGTDSALALAILHVWVTEETYDKEYLDTHAFGFDEEHMPDGAPAGLSLMTYLLGKAEDGIEKTPEWAAPICGISANVIRVLAREWATKRTSLWAMAGGACRRQFAHELSRLQAILQAAQGIGKPGINIIASILSLSGPYDGFKQQGPAGYADGGINRVLKNYKPNSVQQKVQFQLFCDSLENPPQSWEGGCLFNVCAEEWFAPYTYPAEGCSEIHFIWQRGSTLVNLPNRNRHVRGLRNPKIETFIVSAPWFDRDCHYADIVLPATTMIEREDLTEPASVGQYVPAAYVGLRSAVFHKKAMEPSEESKTEREVLTEIARRLGFIDEYLEGETDESFLEKAYAMTNIPLSFEEFKDKGYYVWPKIENYVPDKQLSAFYTDPEANPLQMPSGKIEVFSTQIYEHYGYNPEIPPIPHYIPEKEGRFSEELRQRYPLQMLMTHPKFRFHGKYNDCSWLSEHYKVYGPDGYPYEPMWINPVDAASRGIEEGDIVRCFNNRGQVLAGAHITERLMTGVAWLSYGSWGDPLDTSESPLDRGGDGNYLSNSDPMSAHHIAGAFNSNLFEIERANLDELFEKYPEGMAGKYSTWNKEG